MFTERTSVRLNVHARSVAAAAIDGVTGELVQAKLTPAHEHIRTGIGALPGPVAVASGRSDRFRVVTVVERGRDPLRGGRALEAATALGYRVKTDAKDAATWPSCCAWTRSLRSWCPPWTRSSPGPDPGLRGRSW